ncbi:hypothetical protein QFZ75_007286 [Streptomyces sp. V3I8]|nr:hypothetical protein [Streptomyces sp. V3I8]
MDPSAGGECALLAGDRIQPVHPEQAVPVVRVQQGASVARPRRPHEVLRGRGPAQRPRCRATRSTGQPERVEGGEGDVPAVGRQRGQVDAADRAGAPLTQVVLLDRVVRPVHGQHALEGDDLAPRRLLRPYEGEVAVDGQQELPGRRPAGRHRRDVPGDGDGLTVDDERAGAVRRRGGPQIRQAAVRRGGGRHDLCGRGVGVLHDDGAGSPGGDGGDGTGLDTGPGGGGDALRAYEEDPLPVGRPGGVEVLPGTVLQGARLTGQSGQPGDAAGAQVQYVDAVRAAGHRVAAALGGEGDTGAVGRPGRAAVVEGPVGAPAYVRSVGPRRPEVEAAAPVGAEGDEAAVRRVHRPVGFETGRGEGDGPAPGARDRPQDVLDLGDQPVPARREGRRTVGGRGEGQGEAGGRPGGRGCDAEGGDGARGARGREEPAAGGGRGGVAPVSVHDAARSRISRPVGNTAFPAVRTVC